MGSRMRRSKPTCRPRHRPYRGGSDALRRIGTDDMPVKVLDCTLPHTRQGRFWPYVGDRGHQAVVYDYTPTPERAGPEQFLSEYKGYLQRDAYPGYDAFFLKPERGLVEV